LAMECGKNQDCGSQLWIFDGRAYLPTVLTSEA
jgi:hypothetical protein